MEGEQQDATYDTVLAPGVLELLDRDGLAQTFGRDRVRDLQGVSREDLARARKNAIPPAHCSGATTDFVCRSVNASQSCGARILHVTNVATVVCRIV